MNRTTWMSLTLCLASLSALPVQAAEPGFYVTGGIGADWSFAGRWGVRAEYQLSGETGDTIIAAGSSMESLSLRLRLDF